MSLLDRAKNMMEKAHEGQTRKDGITPYSNHPKRVVEILRYYGVEDEELLIAGYLHDVIEDTNVKDEEIQKLFGSRVSSLVKELTFVTQDYELYIKHVNEISRDAKLVKMADILANLEDNMEKSPTFVSKRIKSLQIILRELFDNPPKISKK